MNLNYKKKYFFIIVGTQKNAFSASGMACLRDCDGRLRRHRLLFHGGSFCRSYGYVCECGRYEELLLSLCGVWKYFLISFMSGCYKLFINER